MSKPEPIEVPSDDCEVTIGDVVYHPHEGETVTLYVGQSVGLAVDQMKLARLSVLMDAAQDDQAEAMKAATMMENAMTSACALLADRVVAWTWTDFRGRPLPQPDGTPGPFLALESSEVFWLVTALKGETPAARKNGSRPSPITSSATGRQRSRTSSGGGRNRQRGF